MATEPTNAVEDGLPRRIPSDAVGSHRRAGGAGLPLLERGLPQVTHSREQASGGRQRTFTAPTPDGTPRPGVRAQPPRGASPECVLTACDGETPPPGAPSQPPSTPAGSPTEGPSAGQPSSTHQGHHKPGNVRETVPARAAQGHLSPKSCGVPSAVLGRKRQRVKAKEIGRNWGLQ